MSGTDEEQGRSMGIGPPSTIGIGPPSSISVPGGETVTGDPERTYAGDQLAAPWRSRPLAPSESATGPLVRRWLFPPQQLAPHEQPLLKEELGRLARDPAPREVWLVLPVRTDQLSEAVQATLRRR